MILLIKIWSLHFNIRCQYSDGHQLSLIFEKFSSILYTIFKEFMIYLFHSF